MVFMPLDVEKGQIVLAGIWLGGTLMPPSPKTGLTTARKATRLAWILKETVASLYGTACWKGYEWFWSHLKCEKITKSLTWMLGTLISCVILAKELLAVCNLARMLRRPFIVTMLLIPSVLGGIAHVGWVPPE